MSRDIKRFSIFSSKFTKCNLFYQKEITFYVTPFLLLYLAQAFANVHGERRQAELIKKQGFI